MKIQCIIIEDEPLAMERTSNYVKKVPYLELKATFYNALEAMEYLKTETIELLFLDIEMDEVSGIELLESIKKPPLVIVTTAYEKYAIRGFELQVVDYLLKPFTFSRFLQAVENASEKIPQITEKVSDDFVFLKSAYRIEKIALDEILFIEGMRDYRNVQTLNKKILVSYTFGQLENRLPTNNFLRVHKSYMINIQHIDFVERNSVQVKNKRIPISESYKKAFFEKIDFME
ncbi:LytR/AlgR family response regulator transcription factor [Ascidiimonas sp. W6]|uniref:LytR/AlgR family response regulator transcription factor n=1 Tax=Ascidiimonas meishanensis TaxID=3128903 RepID=UPI0030EE266C